MNCVTIDRFKNTTNGQGKLVPDTWRDRNITIYLHIIEIFIDAYEYGRCGYACVELIRFVGFFFWCSQNEFALEKLECDVWALNAKKAIVEQIVIDDQSSV